MKIKIPLAVETTETLHTFAKKSYTISKINV